MSKCETVTQIHMEVTNMGSCGCVWTLWYRLSAVSWWCPTKARFILLHSVSVSVTWGSKLSGHLETWAKRSTEDILTSTSWFLAHCLQLFTYSSISFCPFAKYLGENILVESHKLTGWYDSHCRGFWIFSSSREIEVSVTDSGRTTSNVSKFEIFR